VQPLDSRMGIESVVERHDLVDAVSAHDGDVNGIA
jgi:hypothetical protein